MLQKQTIPLPLVRGLDRSSADQLRAPDALSEGLNIEQLKSGEITKRPGFAPLASVNGTPKASFGLNGSVVVSDQNSQMSVLNEAQDEATPIPNLGQNVNNFGVVEAKVKSLLGSSEGIERFETHIYNDEIFVWADGNFASPRLYRFDRNLNQIAYSGFGEGYVNVGGSSGKFIGGVLFATSSTVTARDITDGSIIQSNILSNSITGANAWDVCEGTNGRYIFAYYSSTAGNIIVEVLESNYSLVGTSTLSATNWKLISLVGQPLQNSFLLLLGRDNAATAADRLEIFRYNETPALIASRTCSTSDIYEPYAVAGIYTDSSITAIFLEFIPTSKATTAVADHVVAGIRVSSTFISNGTYSITLAEWTQRAGLASRPFIIDSSGGLGNVRPHIFLAYQSLDDNNLQNCYFLMQADDFDKRNVTQIVCQLQYGKANNLNSEIGYESLPNVPSFSDGRYFTALYNRSNSQFALSAANASFSLVGCEVGLVDVYDGSKGATLGGQTLFAHGGIYQLDPGQVTEYGFYVYPDPPSLTAQAAGSLATTGTYSYVVVYEFYDGRGNLIESSPSQPSTITLTGTDTGVVVTCPVAGWTSKTTFKVSLYRTQDGGTIYNFVDTEVLGDTVSFNDPVVFTDTASDASISSNRLLYTTGGVAENLMPSNPQFIAPAKNRLWTFENGSTDKLWFSKKPTEGFLPAFSDLLTVTIPTLGGELVGVAQLDDKLLVFKERRVYVLFGDGPTANLQGSFSEPQAIVQGMGCIESKSIVETTVGVLYQSQEGIYLIDRSLQNQFLGRPLYKEEGTILTSGYDPILNRVLFLTDSQIWVLYLTSMAWYEWTATNLVSFVFEGGTLWLIKDNGNSTADIMKQGATYQDDGANYEQRIKLGQFQFAGIQGYQRLYRVLLTGAKTTDADSSNVTITTYNNSNTTATDTLTIAHNSLIADNRTELEIRPSKQRCESMEIQLSLTSSTSGLKLAAASAEVGGYTGAGRRAESRRA